MAPQRDGCDRGNRQRRCEFVELRRMQLQWSGKPPTAHDGEE